MRKEFEFFDNVYFRTHNEAKINYYYSGHGKKGGIQTADFLYKYYEIIENIIVSANK